MRVLGGGSVMRGRCCRRRAAAGRSRAVLAAAVARPRPGPEPSPARRVLARLASAGLSSRSGRRRAHR